MAKATCQTAKRLLKCFCGCSDMTEEDVKRVYTLNCGETLIDTQAATLLRKYLEQERSGDKSDCEQYLDVYEKCTEYQNQGLLTLNELDELDELGLKQSLLKDLKNQILTGDDFAINRGLMRIEGDCRNEIEASREYKSFKKALLNKLKQIPT